ncbi:hypothetical protein GR160_06530 [Flavobacterium sp. Sd200]|uniref:hypothetical protein n=1 Tax=Flavobacterium sp. Sd200 TaxID=2692211 RepID=UPI00136FCF20|nr:hypothetical protein [Flavobacterium sp. Sd200]MXN90879.1 hypothetical protein [Flavobacterium sp. Sd200]
MKLFVAFFFFTVIASAQVAFPHSSSSGGISSSERVSNFTVAGAGNDRLEVSNGTQNENQFIPTFWSYRDTSNSFSMVFTSSIAGSLDNGSSPLMLFTTTIPTQPIFTNTNEFVWGPAGTYRAIVNRPLFQWRNSSTRLMTIAANGNVGVNTETPTALLHTVGSVRFENLANASVPNFILGTDNSGNVFEYPASLLNSGGSGGGTSDADWLKPDGNVPMSINDTKYTNGLIGFNTVNPTANLHANGTVRFESLADSVNPSFMLGTDSSGNVFEYPVPVATPSDADWLKPDGNVPMSVNDTKYTNGLIGFNTVNPTANLHANGTVRFEGLSEKTAANFILGVDALGNVGKYTPVTGGVASSDADWIKPDGGVPMNINDTKYTNGLVGFNTNNPTANLHTNGTVRFQNLSNATTPDFLLGTDSSGNVFEYPVPAPAEFDSDWLKLDNTVSMSINDNIYTNGKVGIKTNLIPTRSGNEDVSYYSLFVEGGILTEEVRVTLKQEWADYVFDEDYNLPTLNEVEAYINKEKHLMHIPSEKEVKNDGIELGEMNKLLLQKIEELTLYVIDLNKKIELQQREIDKLKNKQ